MLWQSLKQASPDERGLLFVALSFLLPFPLTCAVLLVTVIRALASPGLRSRMFRQSGVLLLGASVLLLLMVPLFHHWWIGFAAACGLAVVLLFYLFARAVLEASGQGAALFGRAIDFCCLGSVSCFLIAVVQKLVLGPEFRATAGLLNANYYGCMIEFILLACIYRLWTNPAHRRFYIGILLFNTAAIFLCDCQSVWLAVIGGTLAFLLLNGRQRLGLLFGCGAAVLIAAVLLVPGLLPRLDRLPATFETRLNIWITAWRGFLSHPVFGQGLLSYLHIWEQYGGYRTYHAHSLYLDPLLSTGIFGTALSLSYLTLYIDQLRRRFLEGGFRETVAFIGAAAAAVLIHGVTDIPILWVQTGGLLLLIMAGTAVKGSAVQKM